MRRSSFPRDTEFLPGYTKRLKKGRRFSRAPLEDMYLEAFCDLETRLLEIVAWGPALGDRIVVCDARPTRGRVACYSLVNKRNFDLEYEIAVTHPEEESRALNWVADYGRLLTSRDRETPEEAIERQMILPRDLDPFRVVKVLERACTDLERTRDRLSSFAETKSISAIFEEDIEILTKIADAVRPHTMGPADAP